MMSKHTPGPWHVATWAVHTKKPGEVAGVYQNEDLGGDQICDFERADGTPGEQLANADLIAAAPELLERLEETQEVIKELIALPAGPWRDYKASMTRIHNRVAIKKAKGK